MNNVTERLIARVENAISVGADAGSIRDMLAAAGVTGYDAWLAYKAAEVSVRMFERFPIPRRPEPPTVQLRAVRA